MPPKLSHRLGSGDFTKGPSGTQGKLLFLVRDAANQDEAYAAALAAAPPFIAGIPRGSIATAEKGAGLFYVDVDYDAAAPTEAPGQVGQPPPGGPPAGQAVGPELSFSTGGGTTKVRQSLAVVRVVTADGSMSGMDVKNTIGGQAEGVDIVTPNGKATIRLKHTGDLYEGYCRLCLEMTGTVNQDEFHGGHPGEWLFLGANMNYNQDGWDLSWEFQFSPTAGLGRGDPIKIGDMEVEKEGWDYVDVRYQKRTDPATQVSIEVPVAAFVHQVYKRTRFADLGIS